MQIYPFYIENRLIPKSLYQEHKSKVWREKSGYLLSFYKKSN